MTKELTGRHVLIIALCAFGVIITANLSMLFAATGSFPGLVVKNSYVAGVGWNERTSEQQALGWNLMVAYTDGTLEVAVHGSDGAPVPDGAFELVVGRPATQAEDEVQVLTGAAPWRIQRELGPGQWWIEIRSTREDLRYRVATSIFVSDPG